MPFHTYNYILYVVNHNGCMERLTMMRVYNEQ